MRSAGVHIGSRRAVRAIRSNTVICIRDLYHKNTKYCAETSARHYHRRSWLASALPEYLREVRQVPSICGMTHNQTHARNKCKALHSLQYNTYEIVGALCKYVNVPVIFRIIEAKSAVQACDRRHVICVELYLQAAQVLLVCTKLQIKCTNIWSIAGVMSNISSVILTKRAGIIISYRGTTPHKA